MYNKKPIIDLQTYYNDMVELSKLIAKDEYHALISLKRSGWILGVYLSNQHTIPVFTVSEVKSIPINFTKILVVDDKICTGKSFNRAINKLPLLTEVKTACMYIEGKVFTDIWIKDLGCISAMWYERNS